MRKGEKEREGRRVGGKAEGGGVAHSEDGKMRARILVKTLLIRQMGHFLKPNKILSEKIPF